MPSMWFSLLGPLRAWRGSTEIDLGAPQQRALLAVLLVHAGRPAGMPEIVEALWGEAPPSRAVNAVHRNVGVVRRILEPGLAPRDTGRWLVRAGGGYRLAVDAGSLDLLRFRELTARARRVSRPEAVPLLTEALELWRGGPTGDYYAFVALQQEYLLTARLAADAALAAGVRDEVLPVVTAAAARGPLDEVLQARLVRLLAAAGRPAEALGTFRRISERLAAELGIGPGPDLVAARDAVLSRRCAAGRGPATTSWPGRAPRPAPGPARRGR